jgi:hypothetical protein
MVLAASLLTALAVASPVSAAKRKAPKAPSATTIKNALTKAYCEPGKNVRGEAVERVVVTVQSLKRAKPRHGRYFYDGVSPNKKTWVFNVRAAYFCDYENLDPGVTFKPSDLKISGDYIFFRDEFGKWTFKSAKHNAVRA